ncbi:DUF2076 domain-containing protein [Candidatus Pantoea carbekii]|uniref:DUF2076 domain-containing protein n=1 Tax=Candidatus Pantoea carbekii TaxID=1235990 RepID=UPI0006187D82|nr:DUF2076 domain-containing protein [Candidatus Pantoea carbekii]AKC32628.1 putative ABC transporter substrate-binding protein [Candidatus Pantoea carbekii]
MQLEEKNLISGLFQRLKETEQKTAPRDAEAEQHIQNFIEKQPSAPYYMAQSILIQEAALNRLNEQVLQLQNEITQLKAAPKTTSTGFLSGLFGNNRSAERLPQQAQLQTAPIVTQPSTTTLSRSSNFMSGALQTAAGVAGGMVLGNVLTNMFHHSAPEEIFNIMNYPTESDIGSNDSLLNQDFDAGNLETFNNLSDQHFIDHGDTSYSDFHNEDDGFF